MNRAWQTLSRSRVIALTVMAAGAAAVLLCVTVAALNRQRLPVLGHEPLPRVRAVENHKAALGHWLSSGLRNAVLINIDAHDDTKRIPDRYVQELRALAASEPAALDKHGNPAVAGRVTSGNFLYAAAKLGIFKEIYWLVPTSVFQAADRENLLVALLGYYNFLKKDIRTFAMAGNCFRGQINGIAFNLCGLEALPDLDEPVVLSLDADFCPAMAESYGEKLTDAVLRTFTALAEKRYMIQDAVVAYSVDGGHLHTYHRWVGDLLVEILRRPRIMAAGVLPARYQALQRAELLLLMGRYDELFEHLLPFIETTPAQPAMLMYQAFALAGVGAVSHAYSHADQACLADRDYCYGLCELGGRLLADHGLAAVERFFARGYELRPDMEHGQFNLAQALVQDGRLDEAIHYFTAFRRDNGPFPVDFYLGRAYLAKSDEGSALTCFHNARHELLVNPLGVADFGDTQVILDAIEFYNRKGYARFADELETGLAMRDRYYADRPSLLDK